MSSGMAAAMRYYVASLSAAERAALVLQKPPYSRTGFVNIIKVGKMYGLPKTTVGAGA